MSIAAYPKSFQEIGKLRGMAVGSFFFQNVVFKQLPSPLLSSQPSPQLFQGQKQKMTSNLLVYISILNPPWKEKEVVTQT